MDAPAPSRSRGWTKGGRFGLLAAAAALLAVVVLVVSLLVAGDDGIDQVDIVDEPSSTTTGATSSTTGASTSVPSRTTEQTSSLPAATQLSSLGGTTTPVGTYPTYLVAAGDVVGMVHGNNSGGLDLFNASDGSLRQTVAVRGTSVQPVFGFGSIWVPDDAANSVTRVDPLSGVIQAVISVPGKLRFGAGSGADALGIWFPIEGALNRLARVDPATNTAEVVAGPDLAWGFAATDTATWVASSDGKVHRLGPTDHHEVAVVQVGGEPLYLDATDNDVWILARDGNFHTVVHRIDATTNKLVGTIEVDEQYNPEVFYNVAVSGDRVWVATTGASLLVQIDAATNTVVGRYRAGDNDAGGDVAVVGSSLWVINSAAAQLIRIPVS